MSAVLAPPPSVRDARLPWLLAIAGFVAMYAPVWWWAAQPGGLWQSDDHAHEGLIFLVVIWLFWRLRHEIVAAARSPSPWLGSAVFLFGAAMYFLGRWINVSILEMGSQPFVAAGLLLLIGGRHSLAVAWFAVFYFVFMVPLPGMLVDSITQPLKQWISAIVVDGLYAVGYPISRTGVILTIGQYQLLVADACSGLHSMYSLSALGTLFLYLMGRRSVAHNAIMLAAILPIAFLANIVRVTALVLITYHFGDEAGQGFLHAGAGFTLMIVAVIALFALDAALARILGSDKPRRAATS